jgi:hypothetical protein
MDMVSNINGIDNSTAKPTLPYETFLCPGCELQTGLQLLIAELLCENQKLRFSILEEQARIGVLENPRSDLRTG